MADEKPLDPSAQFQEYVTEWERSVDKFFNQLMGTEQFSQSMNQLQKLQLEFQKNFRDAMANQLVMMNIPSRDDLLNLAEQVRSLDDRMARIEAALSRLASAGENEPKRRGPARTRRPPGTGED
ncbi:MAG: hypothetical protein KDI19_12210 [Pseudomonadales bacterium]|nr:hypothetical protein [Pseudomonadales bacterium]